MTRNFNFSNPWRLLRLLTVLTVEMAGGALVTAANAADGVAPMESRADMPPGRPGNRVRFCGFGGDGGLLDALAAWWPNLDYCRAYDADRIQEMADLSSEAAKRGIRFTLQAAGPVMPEGYLDKHGAWAVDFLNRRPPELGFAHPSADYCHPATMAAMKGNLDTAIKGVGASSLSMVDFVWPWVGGSWGYTEACFKAYREALAETDGGLRLKEGGGRVMHFWEYFGELSGVRFSPSQLGYQDWREFEPARSHLTGNPPTPEQRRNVFLFRGLFHWCWLKYAQDAGAHARALGGELQASLNPENSGNGTDILMWGRMADTGEPWLEQWGSPWTAMAGYHTYRYFTEPCRAAGKRLGLIAETGAAGGHPDSGFGPARPHYWDPNSNYIISWALGAAGRFDDREEDYIWASPEETFDPAGQFHDGWRGYVKGMDGFWQYALDSPSRPRAGILSVVNRSILHSTDNSEQSVRQKFSLAPALLDLHLDFEQGYFPLGGDMLAERRIVLFSPWDYPQGTPGRLAEWVEADKSRILVTHSFVPSRPCRGLDTEPVPEVDDPASALPFGIRGMKPTDIKSGRIGRVAPAWEKVFTVKPGTEIRLSRPVTACEGDPLVAMEDGTPLVTGVLTPGGGQVIYLNFCAPERYGDGGSDEAVLMRAALRAVAENAAITPMAQGSGDWACARYDLHNGHAFFLLDRKAARQDRFTEETPAMDPAAKMHLRLKPGTVYDIYDVSGETAAQRKTDGEGNLEIFLSGRSIRLLYVMEAAAGPGLLFSTCERRDGRSRSSLPARLHAHRPGRSVITGIPKNARVYLDGVPAAVMETFPRTHQTVLIPKGDHLLEVR